MEKPVKSHEDDSCENVQNGVSNLVFKHVRVIQDAVFNLSCPRCKKAFYEFDGCAAVTCSSCKAGFCGLCLADCGVDAHSHVLKCVKNREKRIYVTADTRNAAHVEMRNEKLQEYLKRHRFNAKVYQQIVEKIRKDLVDLGMKVPVVAADVATDTSNDVMRHIHHIQENILTLCCPACEAAAFFEMDTYAVVNCYSCQMEFCGLCLDYASNNVRLHVFNCPRNIGKSNFFFDSKDMHKIHGTLRTDRIQSYFDFQITDSETKEKVLAIIGRDLTDLQIKWPEIATRRRPIDAQVANIRLQMQRDQMQREQMQRERIQQERVQMLREQMQRDRIQRERERLQQEEAMRRRAAKSDCCIL